MMEEPDAMLSADPTAAAAPAPRPQWTLEQQQAILAAAAELIEAAVLGRGASITDPTLAGAARQPVSGAFVSLKRRGHLRSCCGGLVDQPLPLGRALHDAAVRTALDDPRFPPLSPSELDHLEMEVWVLYHPQAVQARGEDRVHAVVTGGKHGLVVSRGEARGLLLPGVAAENQWDSRRFLEQVCVKAGLHASLWKDEATELQTFEGDSIRGRLPLARPDVVVPAPALFSPEELATFVRFCRDNIVLHLYRATPNYYLHGAPDGQVQGLVLTVGRPGNGRGTTLSQIVLRPGVPLQATLFNLTQGAAQALLSQGLRESEIEELTVDLAILADPAMHGTVDDPDLAGMEAGDRAVLVLERAKSGLVFDPSRSAEGLVAEAARQADVRHPEQATVFSLRAVTTRMPVLVSTAPTPVRGPAVRSPAAAGRFYPAEPNALSAMVTELLGNKPTPEPWAAALVPHAGLLYSGRLAAQVLKRLQYPKTMIVIGPKHTTAGMDWAVAPQQTWVFPGGGLEADFVLARQLSQAIPGLELDAAAHQHEHAIEVELPFLARLAPESRVVGIALGNASLDQCRQFAEGLAGVLRKREDRPLLLISSDMNHFATDAETRRLDALALSQLERLDPEGLYETTTQNHITMCGMIPAVIVLQTLRQLGALHQAEHVGYATSADVNGDTSRVVGYAGMLFR